MPKILGISAFYHDSAAAIMDNGSVLFAAQEERYTRKKHDPEFPLNAIRNALMYADASIEQLDAVVFYDKPLLKFERLLETYLAHVPKGFLSFARSMPIWLKQKLYLKSLIRRELRNLLIEYYVASHGLTKDDAKKKAKQVKLPPLLFTEHHQSHAAAAYYPSPFEDAAVICLDGVGEWTSTSIWHARSNELKELATISFPHSLGLLYSAFTFYCGFKVNSGEYKLMGLAPYGEPVYQDVIEKHIISIADDGSFRLHMDYFDYAVGHRMINKKFEALFGGKALPFDQEVTQKQMDIARSIQAVTEKIIVRMAKHAKSLTNCPNLCLAGGVALNCVANGKLSELGIFENIWIQPAAGDAGSAIGAALEAYYGYFEEDRNVNNDNIDSMQGAYLGNGYTSDECKKVCNEQGLKFHNLDEPQLYSTVVDLILQDKVIGWFQGRMEFGPRALGNRSIIGDPRSPEMQTKMNVAIKQRESFRPFAPAVLEEDQSQWFTVKHNSPYMLLVGDLLDKHRLDVNNEKTGLDKLKQQRSIVPAITHVDYSARVQSVSKSSNPRFHALISEFKQKTGVGMVINTSFNVRGEPPVCTPYDAIRCFLATEMDVLVLENTVLYKHEMPAEAIEKAKRVIFEKD